MINNWTMAEVSEGLERDEIVLVDVREPHEFAMGHIPGSILLPLSRFDPDELPDMPGKRIVLSCAAGIRSLQAMQMAQNAGRDVNTHYAGGFKDWVMSGGEIERS